MILLILLVFSRRIQHLCSQIIRNHFYECIGLMIMLPSSAYSQSRSITIKQNYSIAPYVFLGINHNTYDVFPFYIFSDKLRKRYLPIDWIRMKKKIRITHKLEIVSIKWKYSCEQKKKRKKLINFKDLALNFSQYGDDT